MPEEMNPKTQECLGHYLYGAGYYAQQTNTLGLLSRDRKPAPHFCLTCPKLAECEDAHERRVRRLRPAQVEKFERLMREAQRRGIPPTMVARMLSNQPGGDPFAEEAVENFKQGHRDHGRKTGPLVR